MSEVSWSDVVAHISPFEPVDLDEVIDALQPGEGRKGQLGFPQEAALQPIRLSFEDPTTVCFGARVTDTTPDIVALAMTLGQMAAEKGATPIILSHVDYAGLEQFGFRVERVGGRTEEERAACEAQICDFWNIVMVI